jgi:hypothetical protein
LAFFSCKEDIPAHDWNDAIITGYDQRLCGFCGGLMVTLSDNPNPYEEPFFQWEPEPGRFDFVDEGNFPLFVQLKYDSLPDRMGNWIEVKKMEEIGD